MTAATTGQTNGKFSGYDGVQTNIVDEFRPHTVLKVANNVNMTKRGLVTNRVSGWARQRAGAFNSGAQFYDFAIFSDGSGGRTLCFQAGDTLYSYDGATETAMKASIATTNPPCIRMFAPYASGTALMLLVNGTDQPTQFASTGAASGAAMQLNGGNYPQTLSSPLPARAYTTPKFVEPFLDRVVIAGFGSTTTAYDVMITNAGTHNTCTGSTPALIASDGGIFQVSPDLGPITGLKAFKLSNSGNQQVLLIGQAHGVSIILGADALTFQCYVLTAEYGIPSNRCWVQMQNDMWFMTTDGVRSFSTLSQNANLINESLTFLMQDYLNTINQTQWQWAHMTHHKINQDIVLWFPTNSSTANNNALVLNYNNTPLNPADPTTIKPRFFTKDGTTVACAIDFKGVMYGGGYTGLLQQHYTGNLYDTTPVQWTITHAQIAAQSREMQCSLERCLIKTNGDDQKFFCNTTTWQKVGNSLQPFQSTPINYLVVGTGGGATVLGNWKLNASAFPSTGPKQHEYEPVAVGIVHEVTYSGNAPDHFIDYVETEYRIKAGGPNA